MTFELKRYSTQPILFILPQQKVNRAGLTTGFLSGTEVPPEFMAMLRESGVVARDRSDSSYERPLTVPAERHGINLDILPPGYAPD